MRLDKVIATFSAESMHVELLHPRVQSTVNHWQSSPGKMHCFVLMGNIYKAFADFKFKNINSKQSSFYKDLLFYVGQLIIHNFVLCDSEEHYNVCCGTTVSINTTPTLIT